MNCLIFIVVLSSATLTFLPSTVAPTTTTTTTLTKSVKTCPDPYETTKETTFISVTFRVNAFENFDDVSGVVTMRASAVLSWFDPCALELAKELNQDKVNLTNFFVVPQHLLWRPQAYVETAAGVSVYHQAPEFEVDITDDGKVAYWIPKLWQFQCDINNLNKFPFDEHPCQIVFELWGQSKFVNFSQKTKFKIRGQGDSKVSAGKLFQLILGEPYTFEDDFTCGHETCYSGNVVFPFVLRRQWYPYYFYGIFLPQLALAALQLSAFFIPNHGNRTDFSISLFVAYSVLRVEVQGYIPQSSNHILVVVGTNLAMLASMLATGFFSVMAKVASNGKQIKQKSLTIANIEHYSLILFAIFYVSLYIGIVIKIAT